MTNAPIEIKDFSEKFEQKDYMKKELNLLKTELQLEDLNRKVLQEKLTSDKCADLLTKVQTIDRSKKENLPESSFNYVMALQTWLFHLGFGDKVGNIDAFFGEQTKDAVMAFQKKWNQDNAEKIQKGEVKKLNEDGFPGAKTTPEIIKALRNESASTTSNTTPTTVNEKSSQDSKNTQTKTENNDEFASLWSKEAKRNYIEKNSGDMFSGTGYLVNFKESLIKEKIYSKESVPGMIFYREEDPNETEATRAKFRKALNKFLYNDEKADKLGTPPYLTLMDEIENKKGLSAFKKRLDEKSWTKEEAGKKEEGKGEEKKSQSDLFMEISTKNILNIAEQKEMIKLAKKIDADDQLSEDLRKIIANKYQEKKEKQNKKFDADTKDDVEWILLSYFDGYLAREHKPSPRLKKIQAKLGIQNRREKLIPIEEDIDLYKSIKASIIEFLLSNDKTEEEKRLLELTFKWFTPTFQYLFQSYHAGELYQETEEEEQKSDKMNIIKKNPDKKIEETPNK